MPKEVALLDEMLIKAAAVGKSGAEMERLTVIPAAQAFVPVKQILSTRDLWSEQEQRQLLLAELHELKESLAPHAIQAGDPESARLLLKTLETIGKRLDSQQSVLDENMIKLSHFQEKVLLRAMDTALNFAKEQLQERYPDITRSELEALVADGLQKAKYEIMEDES